MLKNDKSPGRQALMVKEEAKIIFKEPIIPTKKRKKNKVLAEETYVEQIGKIIQRDFFPSLEKLKAQNDYLDAVEKNDVKKLRELYAKYSGKKPTERLPSPATFETPANIHNTQQTESTRTQSSSEETVKVPKLSLDQFLNSHTSEDNESFEEILEDSAKKHRQKYSYLYNEEKSQEDKQKKLLELPSIEEQCALPEKPFNVDTWGYKNRNYAMFVPDGVELTEEKLKEINEKRHTISYDNTRLITNPFDEIRSKETINEMAKMQAKILDGRIGVDGKEIVKASPKIAGYGFVKEPTPRIEVPDSPFMTWGEIEGTPFLLDGSDTPLPRSRGPSFKMNEPTKREQIAFALAEKASEKDRNKKKKAMDVARKQFATPSPRTSLDRLATMSPAARKLAVSSLGLATPKSPSNFSSPLIKKSMSKTPLVTPLSRRLSTPKTMGLEISPKDNNLTDDLLKIKVQKRSSASDFF